MSIDRSLYFTDFDRRFVEYKRRSGFRTRQTLNKDEVSVCKNDLAVPREAYEEYLRPAKTLRLLVSKDDSIIAIIPSESLNDFHIKFPQKGRHFRVHCKTIMEDFQIKRGRYKWWFDAKHKALMFRYEMEALENVSLPTVEELKEASE